MKRNRLKLVSEATRPIFGIAPVMQGQLSISGSDKVRPAKEHISAMDFLFHVKPGEQQEGKPGYKIFTKAATCSLESTALH